MQLKYFTSLGRPNRYKREGDQSWASLGDINVLIEQLNSNEAADVAGTGLTNEIAVWSDSNTITNRGWSITPSGDLTNSSTPSSAAILQLDSTTKGVLLPRMTTAQQNAISSPVAGLQVWNTDKKVTMEHNGTRWFDGTGALVQKQVIEAGETLEVGVGETVITFGPLTVNGSLNITGGGTYHNIAGNDRSVIVFDDNFLMSGALVKIETDGRVNVPILAETPATTNDGDFWFSNDAGTTYLNYKVSGAIKRVELSL